MIKLTNILTKPVLSLNCCKNEGIVKTGVFNQNFKRLKYLVLFDNEEDFEDKVLQINSIYSNGENAIIIKDDQYLTPLGATTNALDKPSPINSSVFTFLGKYLGKVSDVVLTDTFFVHSIIVDEKEIMTADIISCGTSIVIVQDENQKAKISSLKSRKSNCVKIQDIKVTNANKVYILNSQNAEKPAKTEPKTEETPIKAIEPSLDNEQIKTEILTNQTNLLTTSQNNFSNEIVSINAKPKTKYSLTETPSQPGLVISNFEFLIGRKLEQNIYSASNELIAKKNTKITTDTIIKARMFNKTRELVKFSH